MNVKLQAGEVRVRLSRGEADRLAAGEVVEERVALPGGALVLRADPVAPSAAVRLDAGTIVVGAPAGEVRALLDAPPSKDLGLHATAGDVALVVEIDLWSGKKRA